MAEQGGYAIDESLRSAGSDTKEFHSTAAHSTLSTTSGEVWHTKNLSDVVLVARGDRIKAHKLVLWSQCTNLRDQLLSVPHNGQIQLDVDVSKLQQVLEFVYCEKAVVALADLEEVSNIAQSLGVQDLHAQCSRALLATTDIKLENCLSMWSKAVDIGEKDVAKKAQNIALENFVKLKRSPSLKNLPYSILKSYVTHPELKPRAQGDRLTSALQWIKKEPKTRAEKLLSLMDALPLRRMGHDYLDLLLDDDLIAENPEAVAMIELCLEDIKDEDRRKKDITIDRSPPVPPKEKCLILALPQVSGSKSQEIRAVLPGEGYKMVTLCSVNTVVPDRLTSCCITDNVLYSAGLGKASDEIWKINLREKTSQMCARLRTPRCGHAMVSGGDSTVYILGGWLTSDPGYTLNVEAFSLIDGKVTDAGHLKFSRCTNLVATCASNKLFICGSFDSEGSIIQVYDPRRRCISHCVQLCQSTGNIWGILLVKDHLVMVAEHYTLVYRLQDLLGGFSRKEHLCLKYKSPNPWCGVSLYEDKIFLVGGPSASSHFGYQACVDEVLTDTGPGWTPLQHPPLRGCLMYGHHAMADFNVAA